MIYLQSNETINITKTLRSGNCIAMTYKDAIQRHFDAFCGNWQILLLNYKNCERYGVSKVYKGEK